MRRMMAACMAGGCKARHHKGIRARNSPTVFRRAPGPSRRGAFMLYTRAMAEPDRPVLPRRRRAALSRRAQRRRSARAVEAIDGPVLVLAGAGTGKTRVLTTRLAHILATRRAWPSQILAVTFTNKAAREMRERVGAPDRRRRPRACGSAPSIRSARASCAAMPKLVGLKPNFTILDTDDQTAADQAAAAGREHRRQALAAARAARRHPALEGPRPDARQGAGRAMRGEFANGTGRRALPPLSGAAADAERRRFRRSAAAQPDALPAPSPTCWRSISGASATSWSTSTRTPTSRSISGCGCWPRRHRNLCCVGDDDQSIYGWRGAEVGNILRFEKDFPGATIIRLEQNYRSTPHILAAASGLIANNEGRLGKTLWTETQRGRAASRCAACGTATRRRAGSATRSRRCSARAARSPRSPSWCAPASRPASSRSASSRSACPIA